MSETCIHANFLPLNTCLFEVLFWNIAEAEECEKVCKKKLALYLGSFLKEISPARYSNNCF